MNLQPLSSSDAVSMQLTTSTEENQYQALYKIHGQALGHTIFKVVTNANLFKGVQYSSSSFPIQVFSPLKLTPDHIVLVAGATFQVLYTGGPQPQTNIEFFMDDQETASVSVVGVIQAKKVGKTTLYARSVGHDKYGNTVIFSEDKALVSCISLKEIKIHSPLSRMVVGTEMPLYVTGVTEQENPFTFGTALPAAKFKWTVSNDKVASLHSLYSSVGIQETSENNFRMALKTNQDGLVTVHVEVTLPKESSLTFFGNQQVLSSDIQIQVFKKLKLTNPEVEGGMILLSLNSELRLKCNRFGPAKVTYRIVPEEGFSQSQVVSVDNDGNLIASSKTGSATLLITAVEEFGVVQSMSVIVKVEEIAYMMIKPVGDIKTKDWPLTTLPVGFSLSYIVTYHDNIGLPFDAVRSQLKFRASRHNLARVSFGSTNNTLIAQVVKPGHTVLKVWDIESSIPPDYVRIISGPAIDPSDLQLTVGDVICFGSPLLTKEGHSGSWTSSKSILSVHPVSGGAVALAPGITTVTYSLLNGYSTSTEVVIQDATYISIMPGSINHISNLLRSKPYKIPIVIQSNDTHRLNNIVGRNCSYATENSMPLPLIQPPFSCELNFITSSMDVSINDIFLCTSGFDIEKGMYFCSIEPVNRISLSETSTLDGQISMTVHLHSMDHSSSLSQQQILTFLPAFHVKQQEIILTDLQPSAMLVISASSAVQRCIVIIPSDQSVLTIKSSAKLLYPGTVSFSIEILEPSNLVRAEYLPLHVEISCPITKQQMQIPVKVKRTETSLDGYYCVQPPPSLPHSSDTMYDWHLVLITAFMVSIVVTVIYGYFWVKSSRRGIATTQPVFLNSSNGSHSFSPSRRSPFTPPSFTRYSPTLEDIDNLSQPLRLCSLESSPPTIRRRSDNVFR